MKEADKNNSEKNNNEKTGLRLYSDVLKDICNVEDLHYLRGTEWEGCLGVACVLAFMGGIPANIHEMGKHLEMSPYNKSLMTAFNRLKINGVFGAEYGAKDDVFLKGEATSSPEPNFVTPQHICTLAWCHIAGIAGGFVGVKA